MPNAPKKGKYVMGAAAINPEEEQAKRVQEQNSQQRQLELAW